MRTRLLPCDHRSALPMIARISRLIGMAPEQEALLHSCEDARASHNRQGLIRAHLMLWASWFIGLLQEPTFTQPRFTPRNPPLTQPRFTPRTSPPLHSPVSQGAPPLTPPPARNPISRVLCGWFLVASGSSQRSEPFCSPRALCRFTCKAFPQEYIDLCRKPPGRPAGEGPSGSRQPVNREREEAKWGTAKRKTAKWATTKRVTAKQVTCQTGSCRMGDYQMGSCRACAHTALGCAQPAVPSTLLHTHSCTHRCASMCTCTGG
eukprot:366279-Chlamydomonas_euryale.AAC.22